MEPTTKHALALAAKTLAQSYDLVLHGTDTYIPVDIITGEKGPTDADSCIWLPLTRQDKRKMGNALSNILFTSDSELTNFDLMLKQYATENEDPVTRLLVKTEDGLRVLDETGQLIEPDGTFLPNFISPVLNEDPGDKAKVFEVISGWLNSDEEATSLLRHLSTALSPGWSAIKYILFIGDGRNGKSVLLSMLSDLFGHGNVSHVTRQQIAERLPVAAELNSKLLPLMYQERDVDALCLRLQEVVENFMSAMFYGKDKGNHYIRKALRYMSEHYGEHIELTDVAAYVQLSPSYFSTLFRQVVGQSFREQLCLIRVEESKQLLLSTDYSLTDIAIAVGFPDQSYYCKVFKRIVGLTPGKFRD